MNLLYCLDSNYNVQGLNSINSILEKVNKKLNFYIIHNSPYKFEQMVKELSSYKDHNFNFYQFDNQRKNFPKVKNSHVSDATYYRLFISDYLPNNLEFITYIDADILCFKDPIDEIQKQINEMRKAGNPISVVTEMKGNEEYIENLSLKQDKYFNAGVMVIDYKKWLKISSNNLFIQNMHLLEDKIIWWDQDVLNHTFDGNYFELNYLLNYKIEFTKKFNYKKIHEDVFFLHYQGKTKPWDISTFSSEYSKPYIEKYRNLDLEPYHLVIKQPVKDTFNFVLILIRDFSKIDYKYGLLKVFFKSLLNLMK